MIPRTLEECGLAEALDMRSAVDAEDPRARLMGKRVRFKRGLDWRALGTSARDDVFLVLGVQDDHEGRSCVRVYSEDEVEALTSDKPHRFFGRPARPEELEEC